MVIHYWFKHIMDVANDTELYLTIDSAGSRAFNDFNGIIVIRHHCHTIPPIPNGTEQQEKWVAFCVSMDRHHVNEYIYIYVLFYSILSYSI
jgi:hypothetical protein